MDIRENFLFIDTENCDKLKSRMYGWSIIPSSGGGQRDFLERPNLFQDTYDGSYVFIQDAPEQVSICQDNLGSHVLYLYQTDDYFALSDSFLLLMERLSKSHRSMTLNRNYLDSFILNGYTQESCVSTPIMEVQELTRNVSVRIDKSTKRISLCNKDLKERYVDISSAEAIRLIDKWYEKWTGIIKNIVDKGEDITVDLSGGFDSRIIFMLFVGANIDWGKINISSYKSTIHTFGEDYKIADSIAKYYGTKLNTCENSLECKYIDGHDSLAWSFYIRACFHKQLQFQLKRYNNHMFHFAGVGGESIRHYHASTYAEYVDNYRSKQSQLCLDYDLMPGFTTILKESERILSKIHPGHAPEELGTLLWNEGGDRHHHGREMMEAFGSNELRIGPLLDDSLHKIKYNEDFPYLLNALLLLRFEPKLLEFGFDSKQFIPDCTLREAKRINDLHPKEKTASSNVEIYQFVMSDVLLTLSDRENFLGDLWGWCKNSYESGFVKGNMGKLYPARIYEHAKIYYEKHAHYPLEEMWAAISVAYVVHYTEISKLDYEEDACSLLNKQKTEYAKDVEDFMPRWLIQYKKLYEDCRIILYGAGHMGNLIYRQILKYRLGNVVLWVDKEPEGKGKDVLPVSALNQAPKYDVLIVAVSNNTIQKEIFKTLRDMSIPGFKENKIIFG